jgi:L-seryl-tRNA(Ser) seleniumtransferase
VAIKPPDLLNRLPSVSELLEKPPIRALAARWNKSMVAGGVKSFLDELRNDLQRRAAEVSLPSIRELAEKAASYVAKRQQHLLGVAINATGRIWGPPWTSPAISDAALERAMATCREFGVAFAADAGSSSQLEAGLCRFAGAEAAAVVHSYGVAVWLALNSLSANREVIVARAEVCDIGEKDTLPTLAKAANVILREIGTTNSAPTSEFQSALSPSVAAILTVSSDSHRIIGQTATANLNELVALAGDRKVFIIDALGAAALGDLPVNVSWPKRSAKASLAAGVDLVVLRGDGLVGGPACGILLGRKEAVERITAHPLFAACRLDRLREAALAATLESYETAGTAIDSNPVWHCLSISVDNLRNRAERIAPQLAQAEGIALATAIETTSEVSGLLSGGIPSYGIALSPSDGNVEALENRLQSARFPVVGRVEGERLILELRTVLPRQDRTLVESLTTKHSAEPSS